MGPSPFERPEVIVRGVFATATVVFGVLGLVTGEARLFVASGLFGILWTVWDVVWSRWIEPASSWAFRILTQGEGGPPPNVRPTLDDTIRLLEQHLDGHASRAVQIQSALRLEEIYRTIRRDPAKARAVLSRARERYPDASELVERARLSRDASQG